MAKEPYPSEKQDRFIVRLPDGMRDQIAAAAKANNRSMNAEIVARLEAREETAIAMKEAAQVLASFGPHSDRMLERLEEFAARLEAKQKVVNLLASSLKHAVTLSQYPQPTGAMMMRYFEELADAIIEDRDIGPAQDYLRQIAEQLGIDTSRVKVDGNAAAHSGPGAEAKPRKRAKKI